MGVRLLHRARREGAPVDPGKQVGQTGRMLDELLSFWPELEGREVGIYQALGREKLQVQERLYDVLTTTGFDALRASAMIFDHTPYGPFAQLAIARHFTGPFVTLEGDELAGPMAFLSACTDLEAGRCELALVGTYLLEPIQGVLVLLGSDPARGLTCRARFGPAGSAPDLLTELASSFRAPLTLAPAPELERDPHGLCHLARTIEAAAAGSPTASWWETADGRGMLLAFGEPGA